MPRPYIAAISDGQWHHVAMTATANPAPVTIYIDGVRYDAAEG